MKCPVMFKDSKVAGRGQGMQRHSNNETGEPNQEIDLGSAGSNRERQ